jgi:hypothetical protein
VQIRPRLRSRLELVWNPDAATSPAADALVQHARAFMRRLSASSPQRGHAPSLGDRERSGDVGGRERERPA